MSTNTANGSAQVTVGLASTGNTSTNPIQIQANQLGDMGYHSGGQPSFGRPSSSSSGTSTPSTPTCGHTTWADQSSCELPGAFEDGRCHHHTSERCFHPTNGRGPCSLPGSGPDGRCHIHTRGCNESMSHDNVQKAAFHGLKSAYRWLGMHSDDRGRYDIQPDMAARIAAEVARAYLNATGESYDREASHEYLEDQGYVDGPREREQVSTFRSMTGNIWEYVTGGSEADAVESLKKGVEKAWKQIDKDGKPHADGARTGLAIAEWWFGEDIPVEADDE